MPTADRTGVTGTMMHFAPKGPQQISPGNALGGGNQLGTLALKGRYKRMRRRYVTGCFALSGLPVARHPVPGVALG